jgi:glycosyltransferase involved in cell wall biosynthesis
VAELGLEDVIDLPGKVPPRRVEEAIRTSACLVLPSQREGYGLVVVEAAASATPSVVVAGDDNAATELIEDEVNGIVVESADPEALAAAVVRVIERGSSLRRSTHEWYRRNEAALSIQSSLARIQGVCSNLV